MASTLTIEQYLRGKVGYTIPDDAIAAILLEREITSGTDASLLGADNTETKRLRDLCTADLYVYCSVTPSVLSSKKDSDGNWTSESGGSTNTAYDARQLKQMAEEIYDTYGKKKKKKNVIRFIHF